MVFTVNPFRKTSGIFYNKLWRDDYKGENCVVLKLQKHYIGLIL